MVARSLTDNDVVAAYAAVLGENIGFYGVIIARDIATARAAASADGRILSVRDAVSVATGLMIEFGPAEVLDSALVRPLMIGVGTRWLGPGFGVVVGKIAADILFYIPAILVFERRHRRHRDGTGDRDPALENSDNRDARR
jgi:hypothetical protein